MKFFSTTKKEDEAKDKKKKIFSLTGGGDESKMASSVEKKGINKPEEKKSSIDSDSTKKGRFAWKPKIGDKDKQKEPLKPNIITADVKSVKPPEQQQTFSSKELSSVNSPSRQQSEFAIGEITNEKIERLIELLSGSQENAINPSINLEENRVSYPLLSEIGEDVYNVDVLDKLASPSVAIFERGVYERLAVCPQHSEYFATSLRLYCSACSSLDIIKLNLIEHKACGYIAEKTDFGVTAVEDIKKCPSCKNIVRDLKKEIRILGMWYQCNTCKTKFDDAILKLHCRKFNHDFEINQAAIMVVPNYKLKADSTTLHNYTYSLVPQLQKLLISHGFVIEESSAVKGKSGVSHTASVCAYNNENKTIIIDIKGAETVVDDNEVYSMFGKVFDILPTLAIFIGFPSVSDKAKAMAAGHDISIITDKKFNEIIPAVEQILKTRLHANSEEIKKL